VSLLKVERAEVLSWFHSFGNRSRMGSGVVRGVLVSDLFVCMLVASLTWVR
jgi:hypothetical protein